MDFQFSTIAQMFTVITNAFAGTGRTVYLTKKDGVYQGIDYDQLYDMVECFAAGLHALGMKKGDMLGIASENRLEWVITDFACAVLGIPDIPVFPTLSAEQEAAIFAHCKARCIVVSNAFQLSKILRMRSAMPDLEFIIVMNQEENIADAQQGILFFVDIIRLGREHMGEEHRKKWFYAMAEIIQEDDLLTVIYTSGTTGEPKGVMLSHKNLISNIRGAVQALPLIEHELILSFLPMCHSYERMGGYYTIFSIGGALAFAQSIETVADNMREVKPTLLTAVPRLFERIQQKIYAGIKKESAWKQALFHWAVKNGVEYVRKSMNSNTVPVLLKINKKIADILVFSKIKARTGGNLRMFISGGAALPKEIAEFFMAAGMLIVEGYGLTETSPVLCVTNPHKPEFGTVGPPLPGVEIKIAGDGEILARGPNIMMGYLHNPQATEQMIDPQGWLHTGDIGMFTEKGNLKITDRKKSLFVSNGGKNIAPQPVEIKICESLYIDQCMLIGDKRDFCTALIVPDFEQLKELARASGTEYSDALLESQTVYNLIKNEIDRLQQGFSKFEKIRRFSIIKKAFTVEDGDITPTLKIRRHIVEKKYMDIINAMYGEIS
jgi:long-chain acyl-CoA synthetase